MQLQTTLPRTACPLPLTVMSLEPRAAVPVTLVRAKSRRYWPRKLMKASAGRQGSGGQQTAGLSEAGCNASVYRSPGVVSQFCHVL